MDRLNSEIIPQIEPIKLSKQNLVMVNFTGEKNLQTCKMYLAYKNIIMAHHILDNSNVVKEMVMALEDLLMDKLINLNGKTISLKVME